MGNLLCGLFEQDKENIIASEEYLQLYWLYQDVANANKILIITNRELKRRLIFEIKKNNDLNKLTSNAQDIL